VEFFFLLIEDFLYNVFPCFSNRQVFDILNGKPYEPEFTPDEQGGLW
jgi:hypothetical protein